MDQALESSLVSKKQQNKSIDMLHEPIAIVGMNCQFPGVDSDVESVDAFYAMLMKGQTPIKEVPSNRWNSDDYYDADRNKADKIITRQGGFLTNPQLFDSAFFKLAPAEAKQIDPQHRLFLEVSIRALNHANITLESLQDSNTGVYCGMSSNDYSQLNYKDNVEFKAYTQIGVANSAAGGRLSHFLHLNGPCMVVDTACSSSLAALYLGVMALRTEQCHMAIVGGVHFNLCPENFIGLSKANMLSARGQCRSFDSEADGFARSEGCGVVIVKRLSDAIKDNNTIHAVIKSIVMNQDGDGTSLVAPNIKAQIAMHQAALEQANMAPGDIDYIETHGTGTVIGDAVEFNAIQHIHGGHHSKDKPLIIGALKSNLGHTIASSGIASLIKVVCALKHETIPPNLHYKTPNKSIDPECIPAVIPVEATVFMKQNHKKRLVQVSNYGFTGTNVSAIVEEAPNAKLPDPIANDDELYCFILSANSEYALKQMMLKYVHYLQASPASLRDICYTLINCRDHYKYRAAILVRDKTALIKKIESDDYAVKKVIINKEVRTVAHDANHIYEQYLSGALIRLDTNDTSYQQVDLPLYYFDRKPYWHEPRPSAMHAVHAEPIAIIGMGCRFPKAANIDAFLSLLKNGESGMVDIPLERWDNDKYYDSDVNAPGRLYIKQLGLIDNIKNFDAEFFNISPREAKLMSPQLRILMETTYHALEDANLSLDSIKNTNTGVFVGCERNDYPQVLINQGLKLEDLDIYFATGNALSALSGRIAYAFDFHGPTQVIDTACSSSMTAIHNACMSLQSGDCDMAIAGGINVLLSPVSNIILSKAKMLSPENRCKTFSEDADGYARAEGCGVLVLKRLCRAMHDNDTILAVIKGSAINSDGKSAGFTVPNGASQAAVIRSALAKAAILPSDIDYIEAHGTGTPVADPIEVNTLTHIFSEHHSKEKPLYISSVKTNIGHCESASGVASIIKVVLSLQTQTIFKHLHFKKLNPAIQLKNTIIPLRNIDWQKDQDGRYAGVNSFGFSGANAHVILQQAPTPKKEARILPAESLLVLSAKNKAALDLLLARYQTYLSSTCDAFADICYTAAMCRSHFLCRVAIKASTALEAAAIIEKKEYTLHRVNKEKDAVKQPCTLLQLQVAFTNGCTINWSDFYNSLDNTFEKVKLPLYEFVRESHWFEKKEPNNDALNFLNLLTPNEGKQSTASLKPNTLADKNGSTWLSDYRAIRDDQKLKACKDLLFAICKKIQELTSTEHLDADEGFFDLGFDSLMLTEMAFELQDRLQPTLRITVNIGFDYPSINKLARYIYQELDTFFIQHEAPKSSLTETNDAIAIIGMSCSFPNAPDIAAFENLLEQGLSGMQDIPIERWDNKKYYDSNRDAPCASYVNKLGLIDHIQLFDANFFGISPREAKLMDPQQRIFLEGCYHAIEHANYPVESLRGSLTGVFAGVAPNEYYAQLEKAGFSNDELGMYLITGNLLNIISGRVAYTFDFKGPSVSIDTACSSSLVALHYACQSLKNREIDYALAGGVNVLLMPESNITLCKGNALSPDGQCKTFDSAADGFARSEGCGVLFLKRFTDAINDNDNILAVIKASAVNGDGKSAGLTVPNGKSQEAVMIKALSQTALSSSDISYIEAHGTGTPLGDPIEVHAINRVYGSERNLDNPLYIGSVKANIGHLESASGIASIIKTVLGLQTNKIYKHLHFNQLNPSIKIDATRIALQTTDWSTPSKQKCAGVNAFGFSGTNAHVILQAYPKEGAKRSSKPTEMHVLVLSAKSKTALDNLAARYQTYLAATAHDFADICFTAATRREHYTYRLAVVAESAALASRMLEAGQFALSYGEKNTLALQQGTAFNAKLQDYLSGTPVDWSLYYNTLGGAFVKVTLPHYAFDRRVFWPDKKSETIAHNDVSHPLLGQTLSMPNDEYLFNHPLDVENLSYIKQAFIFEKRIFPAAAYIEAGLAAAKAIFKCPSFCMEKFTIKRQLYPKQGQGFQVQVKPSHDERYQLSIFAKEDNHWHVFSEMDIRLMKPSMPISVDINALKYCFGDSIVRPPLRGDADLILQESYVQSDSVLSNIALIKGRGLFYCYHPALLDGVMQSVLLLMKHNNDNATYQPYAFKRMRVFQEAPRSMWVHVCARDAVNINERCVDIKLYDNTGFLLSDIEGLQLRRVTRRDFMSYESILQHLYYTSWSALSPNVPIPLEIPDLFVISNDPIKAKKRLGNLPYQLVPELNKIESIADKNILFMYEQGQFDALFHACKTLFKACPERFILVTENAYAIHDNDTVNPYHTMASSFWKSFRNELDFNNNYTVDLDTHSTLIDALQLIFNSRGLENQFAVREAIHVPRLAKKQLPIPQRSLETIFDSHASYLIVGGTGGLAKPLINYLIERNVKHIVLISRSECSIDTKALMERAAQKHVYIQHHAADASHYKQMDAIIAMIEKSPHPLKGVFHLAGVIQDGLIVNLTDENMQQVLRAKMESALMLHQLTQHIPLEQFVLFSSSASLLGGRGQSNYAAANGFLDGLAHLRHHHGLPALAINWGPFHTVGMAAPLTKALQQYGFISLDTDSIDMMDVLLESKLTQISPCPMDWDMYFKYSPKQIELSALVTHPLPPKSHFLNFLRQHSKEARVTLLSQVLCEITADVLVLDPLEKITANDNLFSLGLDSLMSLEIRHRIHDKLQEKALSISIEYFIHDPSIDKIARAIADELQVFFDNTKDNQLPENVTAKDVALCDFQFLFWIRNHLGYSSNVGMQLRIHGQLNRDYVFQAFDLVVKQNSVFWLNFHKDGLIQTLNRRGQFNLIYKDISLHDEANTLNDAFKINIMHFIPLTDQPLIRVYLYKINHDLHELHLVIPHIIVDDVSCAITLSQFKASYTALMLGKKWVQMPEKASFLNYVQHNNRHYEKNLPAKIEFWKAYNKDVQMLYFGSENHVPDATAYQPKHLFHYTIAPSLMDAFIDWHKANNLNISNGLIAACQLVFRNISGQKKFPITLIHSGREGSAYKSVVGLFAEYKRINIGVNNDDTLIDCIQSIEGELLKTASYQKCSHLIKDKGFKGARGSIGQYLSAALNKRFLTKYFKNSQLNARLIDYYLAFFSQSVAHKKRVIIKHKLNQLLNGNSALQAPDRLSVLISITPSFFVREPEDMHFANLDYTFSSHFGCLDRPIGNQALWIYFTKNQKGEYQLSINGPLTTACKDYISAEFNHIISTFLGSAKHKITDLITADA